MLAYLCWLRSEFVDSSETSDKESDSNKEKRVGQERIHADCCNDHAVIARKVSSLTSCLALAGPSNKAGLTL